MTRRRWEPEGFATFQAWRDYRDTLDSRAAPIPEPVDVDPALTQADCLICEGTGWIPQYDEFLDGLVDGRCPACQDLTIRAREGRFKK